MAGRARGVLLRALIGLTAAAVVCAAGAPIATGPVTASVGEPQPVEAIFSPAPLDDPDGVIDHVVAISIDGLRPDAITTLGEERTPNLHRLLREGASTLNARNLVELTVTLPNHASMLTSQRISRDAGGLGLMVNSDPGVTLDDTAGREVDSVFDVVHDAGGGTGLYVTKAKFDLFERTWPDAIDEYVLANPDATTAALIERLSSKDPYEFAFLHLRQPDSAGHRYGWMSKRYLAAVEDADRVVGLVLAAIDASEARTADTAIILTSDHGGHKRDHGDRTRRQNYRVPFVVWGPGVEAGADLYALNPESRVGPGGSRPDYEGVQPIRNGEVANLATDLLDLPSVPGSLFNAEQDLLLLAPRGDERAPHAP